MGQYNKGKKILIAVALIFLSSMLVASCGLYQGTSDNLEGYKTKLTWYGIDGIFDPKTKTMKCKQQVRYTNRGDVEFEEIYFHIYPNSFKSENKPVFPPEEMNKAYPNGFSQGSIEFENIFLAGNPASYKICGYSDDILKISLNKALRPGEEIDVGLEYRIKLPDSPGRFGYGENTYNFGNWYPILCVYDERGWNLDPYYPMGDPFYSDIANYRVSIEVPKDYIIASTGEEISRKEDNKSSLWEFEAIAVRDFAWVASNKFNISMITIGDCQVSSYHFTQEAGERALDYGASALEIFNELFGKYPYKTLSIVQTDFFIGGMEYPGLVMIDQSLYEDGENDWLEIVTVHEVAHQWWYGLVGNNQIRDSWMDEGLTEYSTILYYGQRYGEESEDTKYRDLITQGKYRFFEILNEDNKWGGDIHRPLYEFDNWLEYDLLVYGKGAMMFHELRQKVGDEEFFSILKEYFKNNKFKNARPGDLFEACKNITGQSWESFFSEWLYGDYIEKAS